MTWIPYGPHSVLLKFAEAVGESAFARCSALVTELEQNPPAGLVEFVPAFTTILLEFDPTVGAESSRQSGGVCAGIHNHFARI